ncbi:50S ribosomal protein L29 [Rickettsiales endosymbiont of Paramecium tredecaurelia]|uniref:50S ribosomal protein L29 n=1 Tax=Candidatus Sarmatiella mevalonica TaxID=2770581 RepID=UPI0019205EDA|nr:50S ribosomal protein L29 [Candidatus Sarmatiella mevalonica]MBL3284571.1 50S ribosomal protein L29 [Candidatus Sarmatiella mevalonica]
MSGNVKKDWFSKGVEELRETLLQSKNELMLLRFANARGDLKDSSKFRKLRREIARILTAINNKKK